MKLTSFGKWHMVQCLGSGSFGVVYHYRNNESGLEIAAKCFKLLPLKSDETVKLTERWLREYHCQKAMKKNCIVKALEIEDAEFLEYLKQQQQQQQAQCINLPVIIMEYCNGGDLRRILNRIEHKNGLPESEVRSVLNCLRNAINYLHYDCHITHRDIKPENIILQINEMNQRVYKLADFGYVRAIPDMTVAQSVVGTAHYVAPEIIQTGSYNYSVDYWSMGIIAFELICGIRPFLPHRKWVTILENVMKKPPKCIVILEELLDNEMETKFVFENFLLPQNSCSLSFVKQIEQWLGPALDLNYKNRGRRYNELIFYTEMDRILQTNIVTIFSLHNREFFSYVVNNEMSLNEFTQRIQEDMSIQEIHYILPLLHPKKSVENIKKAMDFYVPEWCDTSEESSNPMAMLYVIELRQYDCNAPQAYFSSVSMQQCMQACADESNFPPWVIQDFELKLNYHLTREQRHLQAYMQGLHCFAVSLEHDIILFRSHINILNESLLLLKGRGQQFSEITLCMEKQSNSINKQTFRKFIKKYGGNSFMQYERDFISIKNRYAILQRDSTQEAKRDVYDTYIQQDFYKLKLFRSYLEHQDNSAIPYCPMQLKERLKKCQKYVDNWLKQRRKFHKNILLREIFHNLKRICQEYHKTQIDVRNLRQRLHCLEDDLVLSTASLCYNMKNNLNGVQTIRNVHINGAQEHQFPFNTNNIIKEAAEIESSLLASLQENHPFTVLDLNKLT